MRLHNKFAWQTYVFSSSMWTLMKQLLQKIDEIKPVSYRRKFDFNNLWGQAPSANSFYINITLFKLNVKLMGVILTYFAEYILAYALQYLEFTSTAKF